MIEIPDQSVTFRPKTKSIDCIGWPRNRVIENSMIRRWPSGPQPRDRDQRTSKHRKSITVHSWTCLPPNSSARNPFLQMPCDPTFERFAFKFSWSGRNTRGVDRVFVRLNLMQNKQRVAPVGSCSQLLNARKNVYSEPVFGWNQSCASVCLSFDLKFFWCANSDVKFACTFKCQLFLLDSRRTANSSKVKRISDNFGTKIKFN